MSAELIVLSVGAAAAALIVIRVLSLTSRRAWRSAISRNAHEMFLGAAGPPLTEAVRQKAVP